MCAHARVERKMVFNLTTPLSSCKLWPNLQPFILSKFLQAFPRLQLINRVVRQEIYSLPANILEIRNQDIFIIAITPIPPATDQVF